MSFDLAPNLDLYPACPLQYIQVSLLLHIWLVYKITFPQGQPESACFTVAHESKDL